MRRISINTIMRAVLALIILVSGGAVATAPASAATPEAPTWRYTSFSVNADYAYARWNTVPDAAGYELSWTHNGDWIKTDTTTHSSTRLRYTGLVGEICGEVRATSASGPSPWSAPRCFVAKPRPPVPTWQVPAVTGAPNGVTAKWNPSAHATVYNVYWTTPGGPERQRLLSTSTTTTLETTEPGQYCAQVEAHNSPQYSAKSPAACFELETVAPQLATPRLNRDLWETNRGDRIGATFHVVSNTSSYTSEFSFQGRTVDTETHTTGSLGVTTHYTDVNNRYGRWCGRVRANGGSEFRDSEWTDWNCIETESTAPQMATPQIGEISEDEPYLTASWNPVPNAGYYRLEWTDDGAVFGQWALSSTQSRLYLGNRTGNICIKVMATGASDHADSDWSAQQCFDTEAVEQLATPQPRVTSRSTTSFTATWSEIPNADSYEVRWTDDGVAFGPTTVTETSSRIDLDDRGGMICVRGRANGSGRYSDSVWSGGWCVDVIATVKLETPTLNPISQNGPWFTVIWDRIENSNFYNLNWTDDGVAFGPTGASNITGPGSRVNVGERTGEICVRVQADGSAGFSDSDWSERVCIGLEIGERLERPAVGGMGQSAGSVSARWDTVGDADSYNIRWLHRDEVFSSSTVSSTTTRASVNIGARTGGICAQVQANGSGDYIDSFWSPTACYIVPEVQKLATPRPGSVTKSGTSVTTSWPAIANADNYNVRWTDDGAAFGPTTATSASSRASLGSRFGEICAEVQANGSGRYSDSNWSSKKCTTVAAPLGTISGTVRSDYGTALANILVCASATTPGIEPRCDTTGGTGGFAISKLPTANYKLEFSDASGNYKRECWQNAAAGCANGKIIGVTAPNARTGINAYLTPIPRQIEVPIVAPPVNPGPPADTNPPIWVHDQTRRIPEWIHVDVHRPTSFDISWCCAADYETPDLAPVAFDVFVKRTNGGTYELYRTLNVSRGSGSLAIETYQGSPLVLYENYSILIVAIDAAGNRSEGLERHNLQPRSPHEPPPPDGSAGPGTDPTPGTPPVTPPPPTTPEPEPLVQELPAAAIEDDPTDSWNCATARYRGEWTSNSIKVSWAYAPQGVYRYSASIVDLTSGRTVGTPQSRQVAIVTFDNLRSDTRYQVQVLALDSQGRTLGRCAPYLATGSTPTVVQPAVPAPAPAGTTPEQPTLREKATEYFQQMLAGYTQCHDHYVDYYEGRDTRTRGVLTLSDATEYAEFLCGFALVYQSPEFSACEGCGSLRWVLDDRLDNGLTSLDPVEQTIAIWDQTWNPGSYWYEGCKAALTHPSNDGHDYCSPAARSAAGAMLLALGGGMGIQSVKGLLWPAATGLARGTCGEFAQHHNAEQLCQAFRLIPKPGG